MNKIVKKVEKNGEVNYTLIVDNGQEFETKRWFEKKTDKWYIVLPKDNPTGRTYISESFLDEKTEYEFETKTSGPRVLSGGGWRSKLTDEEKTEIEQLEKRIEEIKSIASERKVEKVDPNSVEGIKLQMEKLRKKLENAKSKQK